MPSLTDLIQTHTQTRDAILAAFGLKDISGEILDLQAHPWWVSKMGRQHGTVSLWEPGTTVTSPDDADYDLRSDEGDVVGISFWVNPENTHTLVKVNCNGRKDIWLLDNNRKVP